MKAAIILFPGSNREGDVARALHQATGLQPQIIWHSDEHLPQGTDLVVLPGGFSYGDYLRCGAIAKFSPIIGAVKEFAAKGGIRPATRFDFELSDPVKSRSISHGYDVRTLPVLG